MIFGLKKKIAKFSSDNNSLLVIAPTKIISQAILLENVFDKEKNLIASFNDPITKELLEIFKEKDIENIEYFFT